MKKLFVILLSCLFVLSTFTPAVMAGTSAEELTVEGCDRNGDGVYDDSDCDCNDDGVCDDQDNDCGCGTLLPSAGAAGTGAAGASAGTAATTAGTAGVAGGLTTATMVGAAAAAVVVGGLVVATGNDDGTPAAHSGHSHSH